MSSSVESLREFSDIDREYIDGVKLVAEKLLDQTKQVERIKSFVSGLIHDRRGGSIYSRRGETEYVFWHSHGVFVDEAGSVYETRTDDQGVPQVYASTTDGRCKSIPCIQPITYDVYSGPHCIEMRFDFNNQANGSMPAYSVEESDYLRRMGYDPNEIIHYEGIFTPQKRDSIYLIKRHTGQVDGLLTDGKTGKVSRLYAPTDVLATIDEMKSQSFAEFSHDLESFSYHLGQLSIKIS